MAKQKGILREAQRLDVPCIGTCLGKLVSLDPVPCSQIDRTAEEGRQQLSNSILNTASATGRTLCICTPLYPDLTPPLC